jgi:carbamoyl-phosphate synthase large subunit
MTSGLLEANGNVLITSISKKVPLIKAVKKAVHKCYKKGKVIGGDCSDNIVGRYFVDDFWLMPPIEQLDTENLINYCTQNNVKVIIPTRDGELLFFAAKAHTLQENGISTMISSYDTIQCCLDKLLFFEVVNDLNYPVIPIVANIDELACESYVVKERYGAGSQNIALNYSKQDAIKHASLLGSPIFQPFIEGREVSVDLYVGKDGICKGVVARTRELVVNGESQITRTIWDEELEAMCVKVAEQLGIYGHAVFQVLIDRQENYHIIECNNRFGGASSLGLAAGLDSFYWFLLESNGYPIGPGLFVRSPEEKTQVRYAEDLIF